MEKRTRYVCKLDAAQVNVLRDLMVAKGWTFAEAPYAHWRATLDKTTVVAYESGKLCVQGKGTPDFVQFLLEPEILKEARFGYEHVLAEAESPEMFTPHAGIDESGKGDYFGALVIAAVFVDQASARGLLQAGVADSKTIKSAKRISDLSDTIRTLTHGCFSVVTIGPEAYNRLYERVGNVNRMLAWGHARALENLLARVPDCPRALSDQFGNKRLVLDALMHRGRKILLEQQTKAESDIAVAAASVLARSQFVDKLAELGEAVGVELPKGAGKGVDAVAAQLVRRDGYEGLRTVAKLHFRTTGKALSGSASSPVSDTAGA